MPRGGSPCRPRLPVALLSRHGFKEVFSQCFLGPERPDVSRKAHRGGDCSMTGLDRLRLSPVLPFQSIQKAISRDDGLVGGPYRDVGGRSGCDRATAF